MLYYRIHPTKASSTFEALCSVQWQRGNRSSLRDAPANLMLRRKLLPCFRSCSDTIYQFSSFFISLSRFSFHTKFSTHRCPKRGRQMSCRLSPQTQCNWLGHCISCANRWKTLAKKAKPKRSENYCFGV